MTLCTLMSFGECTELSEQLCKKTAYREKTSGGCSTPPPLPSWARVNIAKLHRGCHVILSLIHLHSERFEVSDKYLRYLHFPR